MAIIDVHAELGTALLWGIAFTDVNLARSMQKYSVDKTIITSTIGNSVDFERGNDLVARVAQVNQNMLGCMTVNFNYPEVSIKEMHQYMSRKTFAAIMLSSGTRTRCVTLPEVEEILNAYRRFLKPVFIRTFDNESLLAAIEIAKSFNQMKFVFLSMGGDDWRMAAVLAEKVLNVSLEVSGNLSPDKIKFTVERVGSHRMLYGSGLPYVDPAAVKTLVEDANITDGDKRNIFENSAKRLFGWRNAE